MDPLMIDAMVHAHLQARVEHEVTRRRRRPRAATIRSRTFYEHHTPPR